MNLLIRLDRGPLGVLYLWIGVTSITSDNPPTTLIGTDYKVPYLWQISQRSNIMSNVTSDKKNFSKLLCNLADAGYINPEELFPSITAREFHSKQYNRTNLVIEKGLVWEDIKAASEGGNPCLSYQSFQNLIRLLNDSGKLHGINQEAEDIKGMFDKVRISLWTGRNDQAMISVYNIGDSETREEPDVDTGLDFLTAPAEAPETPNVTVADAPSTAGDNPFADPEAQAS